MPRSAVSSWLMCDHFTLLRSSATTSADVLYLINHFYGGGPAPAQGGDLDGNGQFNVEDLTYLVAYLYGRGPTPL